MSEIIMWWLDKTNQIQHRRQKQLCGGLMKQCK